MEFIIEPLQYGFILRGLIGGLFTAAACATLSAFVVWRGMSFMGDALAHSVLPGIVVAYILGISLLWGALGAASFVVIGIGLISSKGNLREDTAIGVVFTGFFALGILMLSRVATFSDLSHILFGNILGVSTQDLIMMAVVTVIVIAGTFLSFKEIVTASFDPAHSTAIGLSPALVRYIVLIMLALTTVVAIQTVGVVLVLALLVTPGASASLVSRRLPSIIGLSLLLAGLATIIGFYVSFYIDLSSGPSIVLALTAEFLICILIRKIKLKNVKKPI
ncbi:MAG: metal ABC transporter permease [Spirochaetales bacterium]|uniref:Metal ABC transporter permease n=1 Tax=Candidatus Thalassospirochaeta sargassi TaxID=3119039 RepID=A0AAJ1ICY4_9SPIO|nr:metal ABC transporter permease [Spirochaetales bacterium]